MIVGPTGAGKTTLATHLADLISGQLIDLDALYHGADWQPVPTAQFRDRVVEAIAATDRWVVAGNYATVTDIVHGAADTVVWLDLPRALLTWRVARRSARRLITRQELWNGNRETLRNVVSLDPEKSVVAWAWKRHGSTRPRYEGFYDGDFWDHVDVHRLRSSAEVRAFEDWFDQQVS